MQIVAVADRSGVVYDPTGLDVHKLKRHEIESGGVAGYAAADVLTVEEFFALDVDVLVPAALETQITATNVDSIRARTVLEAANGPVTAEAAAVMEHGGVHIVPDILANAGGVVVSYYEWVQNKTSDKWSATDIDARLRDAMWAAADRVALTRTARGCTRRQAAYIEAATLLQTVYGLRGIFP